MFLKTDGAPPMKPVAIDCPCKLYHFTADRFLPGIRAVGLTRGVLLKSLEPPKFLFGWQWLTTNADWDQSWAEGTGRLPYRRNEVRLTIEIPEQYMDHLQPWSQVRFLVPDVGPLLSMYGDPENWWLFRGSVRPEWIRKIEHNRRMAGMESASGRGKER